VVSWDVGGIPGRLECVWEGRQELGGKTCGVYFLIDGGGVGGEREKSRIKRIHIAEINPKDCGSMGS